jgi:hypothetical protein
MYFGVIHAHLTCAINGGISKLGALSVASRMLPPCFHDMRMERYHHVIVVCHLAESACMSELARVFVPFNHVARLIVNANHGVMRDNLHIHTLIPPKMTRASPLGHSGKW